MGPSGSGKSTLLACLAGLETPDAGAVRIEGVDLAALDEQQRTTFRRDRLGMVFQQYNLVPYLTAAQNVELPVRLAGRRPDRRRTIAGLDEVGLGQVADRLPAALSGGQQQRVAIARALAGEPALLLADEPTGALDSTTARRVLATLRALVDRHRGTTVVMVTHDPVAAAVADRVVFLLDGRHAGTLERPAADTVAAALARLDTRHAAVAS